MAGILTKDTELHYKDGSSNFVRIDHLMSVPELGGDPELVEVTTLQDGIRKNIAGIKDPGDLQFEFLYDNETSGANFRIVEGLASDGDSIEFKVIFPDDTEYAFAGEVSVKINAAGVNEALSFTMTVMLQEDFSISHPSGGKPVTSVSIAPQSSTGAGGSSGGQKFTATVLPADASNKSVTWKVRDGSDQLVTGLTINGAGLVEWNSGVANDTYTITVETIDQSETDTATLELQ